MIKGSGEFLSRAGASKTGPTCRILRGPCQGNALLDRVGALFYIQIKIPELQ